MDEALGAAVCIAMTMAAAEQGDGRLLTVTSEIGNYGGNDGGEGLDVQLVEKIGVIHADLSIGADVAGAGALKANAGVSSPGFKLHGAGFIVTSEQATALLPSPSGGGALGEREQPLRMCKRCSLTPALSRREREKTR